MLFVFVQSALIFTDSDGDSSDEAPKKRKKSRGEPSFNKAAFSMPDGIFLNLLCIMKSFHIGLWIINNS